MEGIHTLDRGGDDRKSEFSPLAAAKSHMLES